MGLCISDSSWHLVMYSVNLSHYSCSSVSAFVLIGVVGSILCMYSVQERNFTVLIAKNLHYLKHSVPYRHFLNYYF